MNNQNEKSGIELLRDNLFAALEGLKTGKIDVATAKAMSDIGQTIINTAKVELDFNKANGSTFFTQVPTLGVSHKTGDGVYKTRNGSLEVHGNSSVHKLG